MSLLMVLELFYCNGDIFLEEETFIEVAISYDKDM